MDYETALQKAKDMVMAAKDIVVVTHGVPTKDSMGSSLALMLGLVSLGKKSTVICPDPMTVELSSFVGADKVTRQFGKKNFVISLDYIDGSIEKVSYNIEGKKFNLVVEHRPGHDPITPDNVQYDYQGVSADLIISVDTQNFGDMGHVYSGNKEMFAGKQIINIDFHDANSNYGAINLVDPGASSTTELVAEFMATLGVKLTADIATNLLNAVYDATDNFKNANVTSMAFEVASVCMKAGGKRFGLPETAVQQPAVPAPQTVIPQTAPAPQPVVTGEPKIYVQNKPVTPGKPEPVRKQEEVRVAPVPQARPEERGGTDPAAAVQSAPQENKPQNPPDDWLKPKIFKSSGSLA